MKVFFASFTDPSVEVDAHVNRPVEGILILDSLRRTYRNDSIILRARLKSGEMWERRYIGLGSKAGTFIKQLKEELKIDG